MKLKPHVRFTQSANTGVYHNGTEWRWLQDGIDSRPAINEDFKKFGLEIPNEKRTTT